MFTQTDSRINPVARWGCYFCSIVALDEYVSGIALTDDQFLELWKKNIKEDDVGIDMFVADPQGLLDDLSTKLTFKGKFPPEYVCKANEYEILVFQYKGADFMHFVLGDGKNNVIFDPYPNSKSVREGKIIGKRIYAKE